MGGLYSRVKTWVDTEDVTYSDLNAEFDNVITNFVPLMIDDYSTDTTQMRVTADPGEVGTESRATTLGGELARIRFILKEITGKNQWYETPVASLAGLSNAVGTGLTDNRIVSGRVRTGSQMPIFLVPHGAAKTVTAKGATTNLIYYVEGTEYTITTDTTLTGLTAAPSSNNTALVNDTTAADQYWTKYAGEDGSEITIDNVGTEITSLVGKLAGFKIDNGSDTEYFIAEVGTDKLIKAQRGYFFDSSDNPIPRVVFSNNDTITLMKLTWVFAKSDLTLTATYNPPTWGKDEPSSPALGDYWFDTDNNKWKVYGVGAFADADAMLIGCCIQDATNTVGARSFEPFLNFTDLNTIELIASSNSAVVSRWHGEQINVWGTVVKNDHGISSWDMTVHLDSGVTESANTYYYMYVTEEGDRIISDIKPHDRREDLLGYFHPHQSWKCVGSAYNDGSSNLSAVNSYYHRYAKSPILPVQTAAYNVEVIPKVIPLDSSGGTFTHYLPPAAYWRGQTLAFVKTTSDLTKITIEGFGSETINGATSTTVCTQYEYLELISDGTNIYIKNRRIPSVLTSYTPTGAWVSNTTYSGFWKRVGDSIILYLKVQTSGAPTSAQLTFSLPTGAVIDTTKLPLTSGTDNRQLGEAVILDSGTGQNLGSLGYSSTTALNAWAHPDNTGHVNYSGVTQAVPFTWANNDNFIGISKPLPIVDWGS